VKLLVAEQAVSREHPLSHTYTETTERWKGWHSHLPLSTSCVFHPIAKHSPLSPHSCEQNGRKTDRWGSSSYKGMGRYESIKCAAVSVVSVGT